jgi:PTH1 family peptidyl-tRNA hydrolase
LDWLIVGLGNPGKKYEATRHNMGREVVVQLAQRHDVTLDQIKHHARFATATIEGRRVCLATPTTFMNESGRAVGELARFYKVSPQSVLLVCDDLDLPLGRIRIRASGGAGGHRGVASALSTLGTPDVPRLRLGIGRPPPDWDAVDYVLARFGPGERAEADEAVALGADAVEAVLRDGLVAAMNRYN